MPFLVSPPNLDYFWEMGSAYICILWSLSSGKGPPRSGLVNRLTCSKETCPISPRSPGLEKKDCWWLLQLTGSSISASSLLLLSMCWWGISSRGYQIYGCIQKTIFTVSFPWNGLPIPISVLTNPPSLPPWNLLFPRQSVLSLSLTPKGQLSFPFRTFWRELWN